MLYYYYWKQVYIFTQSLFSHEPTGHRFDGDPIKSDFSHSRQQSVVGRWWSCSVFCRNVAEYNRQLYLWSKRQKCSRNCWVHSIIKIRYVEGTFYSLFDNLVSDDKTVLNFFRIIKTTFDFIAVHSCDNIKKEDTIFLMEILPEPLKHCYVGTVSDRR